MHFKPVFCLMAVAALLLATGEARADTMFYDVDAVTLPGGPISLVPGIIDQEGDVYTLHGTVENSSAQTYYNVEYLNEFVFDTTVTSPAATDMPFSGGSWSDGTNTLSVSSPPMPGMMLMSDTNLPLGSGAYDNTSGLVSSGDVLPYIYFGTVPGSASIPFTETVMSSTDHFTLRGSFVATPEPSTLVLLGIGAIGALFFVGKNRRAAVI